MPTRKKKSYRRRFNDRRINTAIERKIQDIARKEDEKNEQWYVNKHLITLGDGGVGDNWPSTITAPDPNKLKPMVSGIIYYTLLTDIGGYGQANITPTFPLNDTSTIREMKNQKFIIKTLQANLKVANRSFSTIRFKAIIVYIPNINSATDAEAQRLLPSIHMLGNINGKYPGIFSPQLMANATYKNSVKDFTIIASKTIVIQPSVGNTHWYLDADPPGSFPPGVYPDDNYTLTEHPRIFRNVNIRKDYKVGKKLYYNLQSTGSIPDSPDLCSNGNFYLVYGCDGNAKMTEPDATAATVAEIYGVAGCKFKFGSPMYYINKT